MSTENFRFYIKTRTALNIQARIIHDELYSVYGDQAPSLRTVERWSKLFRDGREELEDTARPRRPITETTSENIEQIRQLIDDDPYLTIEELQEQTDLSYGTIHRIITNHLNLRKITARYIPKDLTDFQRAERVRICKENLSKFQQGTWRLCDIITGDESWFYHKQIGRKSSNAAWVRRGDPPPTVVRQIPMRASSIDIHPNAKWAQNGITVAGGNGKGSDTNQLNKPCGLYVDDDQTIYVADYYNHRIVEWTSGATNGKVAAGGNGEGNGAHQLNHPVDVIVDKESDSLIISDSWNSRVVRWPRRNGTRGETIISNFSCCGLTMDDNGSLYVIDIGQHEVRRYKIGDTKGTVVAGGNGKGNRLDQLSAPHYVFVDRDHSVYVSDYQNHRVMKWEEDATQGIIVAGGQGEGNSLTQLCYPNGVVVNQLGTVYVADFGSNRIMRWPKGSTQGSVIVGENGERAQSNQLFLPIGLSFDRHGNLYVADSGNDRVQKFNIE
ncbi:unnamed protein product [Rotaria sp. Silwood1]|nr:unnamed protein product [Rotaria sp. Silwood1]CAF1675311.1 unnamed protein product [Rotaria sp. Silwood1]